MQFLFELSLIKRDAGCRYKYGRPSCGTSWTLMRRPLEEMQQLGARQPSKKIFCHFELDIGGLPRRLCVLQLPSISPLGGTST